jgi:hypothetical protein
MSVQEEQELRERLGDLLDGLEPRPARVALAVRQGTRIRIRRWVTAAAGLAVVAGGAAALPAVVHIGRSAPPPSAALRYSLTVHGPGKNAPKGLIAYGTQDGDRWTVVISGHGSNVVVGGVGVTGMGGVPSGAGSDDVEVNSVGGSGAGGNVMLLGAVGKDVTKVAFTLPGGEMYALTPVRYLGQRYVAIVLPYGVPVVLAVAYDGQRELAYSVPYDGTSLIAWWAPGRVGPPRFSQTIGAGVIDGHAWRFSAQYGPWGYCYTTPNGNDCTGTQPMPTAGGTGITAMTCGGLTSANSSGPTASLAAVGSEVRAVAIRLSGGTSARFPVVDVQGTRLFAYVVPSGQNVVGSTEYGAAGQVVAHDRPAGALDICG